MVDEQDQAESLDDDELPPQLPPDEPYGVGHYGTTAAEERWDEPLAERVTAEVPDEPSYVDEAEDGFEMLSPDEGVGPDTESAAVASLVERDLNDDTALEREGVRPPEEAAMHYVDEDEG